MFTATQFVNDQEPTMQFDPFLPSTRGVPGIPVKVVSAGVVYHYESPCKTAGAATLEALERFGQHARIVVDARGVNHEHARI